MSDEIKDPDGALSIKEYIGKLREFAFLIHPKVLPNNVVAHTPQTTRTRNNNDSLRAPKPKEESKSTPKNEKQTMAEVPSPPNAQRYGPRLHDSNYKPGQFKQFRPNVNFSHPHTPRPGPLHINVPPTKPFIPQPYSGEVPMDGNVTPAPKSGNQATPKPQLGRLVRLTDEQIEHIIWARIDSGADDHIAGKDTIGHGIPAGRHPSLFAVPLQRKSLAAECVKVHATTETNTPLQFTGVISPSTSTCLRPTALSFDADNPNPEVDYAVIEGQRLPVHLRNGAPYVKLILQPGASKTRRDFCTFLGLVDSPTPTDADLAYMLHIKYACAGIHTIDITCRILGFPLPFQAIREGILTCRRCASTETFMPVRTVLPTVSVMERVSPAQDTLVFDAAEMPVVSYRGNKNILVAKLIKCGKYFIRPGGRSSMADQLIKMITSMRIPIVACMSDRSLDFSRVRSYCQRNNITYIDSHQGRDEYKGHHEAAVSQAKATMEWWLHNWDHEQAEGWWEMAAFAAEHTLNTRASPSRLLIPFHVAFGARPRYDLMPLSAVT